MEEEKQIKTDCKGIWNEFLSFFDDKSKGKVNWRNRNYFYAGTILVVIINIFIFACVAKEPWDIANVGDSPTAWGEENILHFNITLSDFLSSFFHVNWQHVLLNMFCFLVAGIYLERKQGTVGLFLFVLFASYVSSIAWGANALSMYGVGFSGVNYFIYATIILDYIFSFQTYRKNETNIVLGAIVVALIYIAMCFNGGTATFSFSIIPYDLIHNSAHYTGFLAGLIIGIFTEVIKFTSRESVLK